MALTVCGHVEVPESIMSLTFGGRDYLKLLKGLGNLEHLSWLRWRNFAVDGGQNPDRGALLNSENL